MNYTGNFTQISVLRDGLLCGRLPVFRKTSRSPKAALCFVQRVPNRNGNRRPRGRNGPAWICQAGKEAEGKAGQREVPYPPELYFRTPFLWMNPRRAPASEVLTSESLMPLSPEDFEGAKNTWGRIASLVELLFPECQGGLISSPLTPLGFMGSQLAQGFNMQPASFLKRDNDLPICGSVKARGGVFEVLKFALGVLEDRGILQAEDEGVTPEMLRQAIKEEVFQEYMVLVGSTGNLGLSVGLAAGALGMKCKVHASRDAVEWKLERLRGTGGVEVVEHEGGYTQAVAAAREEAKQVKDQSKVLFVDDENSTDLILGYASGAWELVSQLESQAPEVFAALSPETPLVVHIPCGVGGAPAGILWGLHTLLGDKVRVLLAEPTAAPCMALGLSTQAHDRVSVDMIGLDSVTVADGLAVSRPSGLACRIMDKLVAGVYTVQDEDMLRGVAQLLDLEGVFAEPSSCCTLMGPAALSALANSWAEGSGPVDGKGVPGREEAEQLLQEGFHVLWLTGGGLVPEAERERYNQIGLDLLRPNADMQSLLEDMQGSK